MVEHQLPKLRAAGSSPVARFVFMGMDERTVTSVVPGSPADAAGVAPGDIIVSVNGEPIADALDWTFLTDGEETIEIEVLRGKRRISLTLEAKNKCWGVELAELRVRRCRNRCIFCFVDQQPPGLRSSLYVKDEDYRFSFLYGSFVTLTDLSESDWERIGRFRLSPLYVSVHSTDETVRRRLLGRSDIPPILGVLERLARLGIDFHAQVVLVPGYNDKTLDRTTKDLLELVPHLLSLAVVPVGLTKYRRTLPKISPVSPELAQEVVRWHWEVRRGDPRARGRLQLADEFFILAQEPFPEAEYYAGYPQYENGVGMVRDFLDAARRWRKAEIPSLDGRRIGVVTGKAFAPLFERNAAGKLSELLETPVRTIAVENEFWGERITVANLLVGADIARACAKHASEVDMFFLPPRVVNADGITLDDKTPSDIARLCGKPVFVASESYEELPKILAKAALGEKYP